MHVKGTCGICPQPKIVLPIRVDSRPLAVNPMNLETALQPQEIAEITKNERLGLIGSFTQSVSTNISPLFFSLSSLRSFVASQLPDSG